MSAKKMSVKTVSLSNGTAETPRDGAASLDVKRDLDSSGAAEDSAQVGFEDLLARARRGSPRAIGEIIDSARAFLLFVAARHLPQRLWQKVGASDVVQNTAIEAQQGFNGFQGTTEAELFAWMRKILLNNVSDAIRHFEGTAKRNVSRERSLQSRYSGELTEQVSVGKRTPDDSVMRHEDAAIVAEILGVMSPQYREVLHLRYWEQCSFIEIGIRMNRSAEAARKLWYRAVEQFNEALSSRRAAGGERPLVGNKMGCR